MVKKIYIKDESFDPIYKEVSRGFFARTRIIPSLFMFTGITVFLTQVMLPLVVFTTQDETINLVDNATLVGRAAGFSDFAFTELDHEAEEKVLGYTKEDEIMTIPNFFSLSIPRLGIENALVETNSHNLNPVNSLGHYPGTKLPGENGNSFIFGHSVLPWFFNPKNYKTIFSTLPELETGDKIIVNINKKELTYVVESIEELVPEKVNPLAEIKPAYLNESTIVLMTCSPPGTKLKRLLVNAVLE